MALAFHSIVGGGYEEGLFGITELDATRFAVVGSLNQSAMQNSQYLFPLMRPYFMDATNPLCLAGPGPSTFGTLLIFDASQTLTPTGLLELELSTLIGSYGSQTVARDIIKQGDYLFIVGSTNDANMPSLVGGGFQPVMSGATQGYVATWSLSSQSFKHASYFNSAYDAGLVGVSAWSEYPDHVAVVGWTKVSVSSPPKIEVASLFVDTPHTNYLQMVRSYAIGSATLGDERPGPRGSGLVTGIVHPFVFIPGELPWG
ncbi:MAG: hypothetical protein K8J09_08745, partial [Planctomycetes bacterium]|nr:hypothetical protein [Planctomycetota bacterium]